MQNEMNAKIPATVVTGFLGAGKTTLIRNLLNSANGRKIALVINEFGDMGVDAPLAEGVAQALSGTRLMGQDQNTGGLGGCCGQVKRHGDGCEIDRPVLFCVCPR